MKRLTLFIIVALLAMLPVTLQSAQAQSVEAAHTERLQASRIREKGNRRLRALRPMFGLPQHADHPMIEYNLLSNPDCAELVNVENGIWTSRNLEYDMPNWIAWDMDVMLLPEGQDPFLSRMPADKIRFPLVLWRSIMEKCREWALTKPAGPVSVACGPLVIADNTISKAGGSSAQRTGVACAFEGMAGSATGQQAGEADASIDKASGAKGQQVGSPGNAGGGAVQQTGRAGGKAGSVSVQQAGQVGGKAAMPYAYYLVVCKKTRGSLGYKSIGFIIPNEDHTPKGAYGYSDSVNLVEYRSGFDFFSGLPVNLEELVEGMTTYELFCPFVESEQVSDEYPEFEMDYETFINMMEEFDNR